MIVVLVSKVTVSDYCHSVTAELSLVFFLCAIYILVGKVQIRHSCKSLFFLAESLGEHRARNFAFRTHTKTFGRLTNIENLGARFARTPMFNVLKAEK